MTTAFNDAPPAPRASSRHLTRFVVIALGIGAAMLLQAHRAPAAPVASRVPLYLGLIAVEITLVWFVAIGVRARGYHLVDLCGLRWNNWPRAAIDLICASPPSPFFTRIYGLIFGLLAALRRSILPGAIAHSIIDIAGG